MRFGSRTERRNDDALRASKVRSSALPSAERKPHPFSGQLVDGGYAANWLIDALSSSNQPIDLCSAFFRSEALLALLPKNRNRFEGRVLARWQLGDLLVGASDLQSYIVAKELGFKFFIRQDFHGKVFSVPNTGVIVGSANATLAGFGMKNEGNAEVCTLVPSLESNTIFINDLFNGAVEINDNLFAEIGKALLDAPLVEKNSVNWPKDLMNKIYPQKLANRFFTSECLISVPAIDSSGLYLISEERDRKLLGLHDYMPVTTHSVAGMLKELKVHRWLVDMLRHCSDEMYFGTVTAELHNALLDDPVAYRREVKVILQTLLLWYELFPECGVLIDRPNQSQRIRLG